MNRLIVLQFICLFTYIFPAKAQQEELFFPTQNDTLVILNASKSRLKSFTPEIKYSHILTLPFFDDFARDGVYPSNKYWADKNVFINNTFCVKPPSINVATFDALGSNGLLYKSASSSVFASDTLTSLPINLLNYRTGAASNTLYRKKTDSFIYLGDSIYSKTTNGYKTLVSYVFLFYSGDSLYRKIGSSFFAIKDSLFTKTKNGFEYLEGSYENTLKYEKYSIPDSVTLKFSIQPGGIGDMPEDVDSLFLETYIPYDTNKVLINEVSASQIELYNSTDTIVDLAGFYLLNDTLKNIRSLIHASNGTLSYNDFCIPKDGSLQTQIPPYGLLVISASNLKGLNDFTKKIIVLSKDSLMSEIIDSVYIEDQDYRTTLNFGRFPDGAPFNGSSALSTKSMNSLNGLWHQMWSESPHGLTNTEFVNREILIPQSLMKKGFRFRFINYASLSNDKSHARNEDFWNLDNVSLTSQNSSSLPQNDLKFRNAEISLYESYSSIPYEHVLNISEEQIKNYLFFNIENTDTIAHKANYAMSVREIGTSKSFFRKYELEDKDISRLQSVEDTLYFNETVSLFDLFTQNAGKNKYSDFNLSFYFTDDDSPLHEEYRWNDTVKVRQSFYNYYAYDDGSSEAGWGIRGIEYAEVAYKFTPIKKDTLESVLMFFNNTLESTPPIIQVCVWGDNKGKPGKLLAKLPGQYIQYNNGINKYSLYKIDQESIVDASIKRLIVDSNQTFYVGWIQPSDINVNIGVDLNRIVKNKLYFKTGIDWESSLLVNPIMIRPVFDSNNEILKTKEVTALNKYSISPNPSSNIACLFGQSSDYEMQYIQIKDLLGNTVCQSDKSCFDVSELKSGIYIAIVTEVNGLSSACKFIVSR